MKELFTFCKGCNIDVIIVSDSNTLFIQWVLEKNGMEDMVKDVFSNPAWFDEKGYLRIKCHHDHSCKFCPVNMCKFEILQEYIKAYP